MYCEPAYILSWNSCYFPLFCCSFTFGFRFTISVYYVHLDTFIQSILFYLLFVKACRCFTFLFLIPRNCLSPCLFSFKSNYHIITSSSYANHPFSTLIRTYLFSFYLCFSVPPFQLKTPPSPSHASTPPLPPPTILHESVVSARHVLLIGLKYLQEHGGDCMNGLAHSMLGYK